MATNDDEAFWFEAVKGVKKEKCETLCNEPHKVNIVLQKRQVFAVKQDFSTFSKSLEYLENGGIDKATLRKFKREEFKIEAVLDLHGCTEDEAFDKVDDFVARSFALGRRCIVIITGKGGNHNEDDIFAPRGVLKQRVPQWLNMSRLRALILVYKNPSERLGGNGALYILLRRNKDI